MVPYISRPTPLPPLLDMSVATQTPATAAAGSSKHTLDFPRWKTRDENAPGHPKTADRASKGKGRSTGPGGPSSPSRVPVRSKSTPPPAARTPASPLAKSAALNTPRPAGGAGAVAPSGGAPRLARKTSIPIPFPRASGPAPPVVTQVSCAPIVEAMTALLSRRTPESGERPRSQSLSALGRRERPSVVAREKQREKEAAERREREEAARREREKEEKRALREKVGAVPLWATLLERDKAVIAETMDRSREYRGGMCFVSRSALTEGVPVAALRPRHLVSAVLQSMSTPYGATSVTPRMLVQALDVAETTYFAWRAVQEAIETRCVRIYVLLLHSTVLKAALALTGRRESGTWRIFCRTQSTSS